MENFVVLRFFCVKLKLILDHFIKADKNLKENLYVIKVGILSFSDGQTLKKYLS